MESYLRIRKKQYLTPSEAVLEGYFTSEKQAANLRSLRRGPPYFRPTGGRVTYAREDLEAWIQRGRILTSESEIVRLNDMS